MKSRAKPFGGQHGPMYKAKPRGEATRISTMWIEFRGMGLRPMEIGGRELSEDGIAPSVCITRWDWVATHQTARSGAILA